MANKKISELPDATLPLGGSESVELVQGGVNKKAPASAFGGGGSGTVESVTGSVVDNTDPANPVINADPAGTAAAAVAPINPSLVTVSVSAGTLTLDMNSYKRRSFFVSAAQSSGFTIALSNTTNAVEWVLDLTITGAVAITMPTSSINPIMQNFEKINGRWNDSTKVLTLTGSTATPFTISFRRDGTATPYLRIQATDPFV